MGSIKSLENAQVLLLASIKALQEGLHVFLNVFKGKYSMEGEGMIDVWGVQMENLDVC